MVSLSDSSTWTLKAAAAAAAAGVLPPLPLPAHAKAKPANPNFAPRKPHPEERCENDLSSRLVSVSPSPQREAGADASAEWAA